MSDSNVPSSNTFIENASKDPSAKTSYVFTATIALGAASLCFFLFLLFSSDNGVDLEIALVSLLKTIIFALTPIIFFGLFQNARGVGSKANRVFIYMMLALAYYGLERWVIDEHFAKHIWPGESSTNVAEPSILPGAVFYAGNFHASLFFALLTGSFLVTWYYGRRLRNAEVPTTAKDKINRRVEASLVIIVATLLFIVGVSGSLNSEFLSYEKGIDNSIIYGAD